jgi:preprotein translocase subunit SecD
MALVVGLTFLAVYAAMPTFMYFNAAPDVRRSKAALRKLIPSWLPQSRMNFGIDLQGGLHLVMGVDTEKAIQLKTDHVGDELVEAVKAKGKALKSVRRPGDAPVLEIVLENSDDWSTLKPLLDERKDTWEVRSHSGERVIIAMREAYENSLKEDAVAQAEKTLRNRIDKYGVSEPEVRRSGANSILIQLAGLTADEERTVKDGIIGKTAQLEFKIVDDESKYFAEISKKAPDKVKLQADPVRGASDAVFQSYYLTSKSRETLEQVVTENPPPADRTVRYQRVKGEKGAEVWRTWLLDRKTPITGDSLTGANVITHDAEENQPYVSVTFDQRGARIFDQLTAANIKKRMAIVLDDVVDSAPQIQSRIPNGNCKITLGGGFKSQEQTLADAKALTIVLKAGALPAPLYPQEERTVGATLGEDAVNRGKLALMASVVFVIGFMLYFYKASGATAILAMAVNMLMLIAALAAFGATLTLPGLAGLALTIGMAVDTNIIQFERIREELKLGKTVRAAIDAGFDRAFATIFDAHMTTWLSALVLYQYGSGPIRGFATTLGVGIVINIFTAVVIPRLCLEYMVRGRRTQTLSI